MTQSTTNAEHTIIAGHIAGAHGVSGNVRVRLIGANGDISAEALRNAPSIVANRVDPPANRVLTLTSLRKQSEVKGAWIARFKELPDRSAAEELYGWNLLVPEKSLPKLPDGEYYVDQLLGLALITDKDRELGNLVEVLHTPANDVYVTSTGAMVPAVSAFIKSIDVDAGRIVVIDVPGLVE